MLSCKSIFKKLAVSTGVSFGLMALTNVDALYHQREHANDYATPRPTAPRGLEVRLNKTSTPVAAPGVLAELRRALGRVELGTNNPFDQLQDLKPLEALLAHGAVHFKRQSYRSPRYQEESGYDLVTFEITHDDHSTSTVVAYLERTLEGPDHVPVILLVTNGPEAATQTLYRNGHLSETQTVPLSVAQSMVAQRINGGVPFLSVSR